MGEMILHFFAWSVRRIGVLTLLLLGLLYLVLGNLAGGLALLSHRLSSEFLGLVALAALVLGWLMARSTLKGWQAGIWATLCGLTLMLVGVGQLTGGLLATIGQALLWLWLAVDRSDKEPLPDSTPLLLQAQDLGVDISNLAGRLGYWLYGLLGGGAVYDPLAAQIFWGLAIWAAAAWAAWAVRRRGQPVLGVLPAALLLAFSASVTRARVFYFIPLLVGAFLLFSWDGLRLNLQTWRRRGVDYSDEMHFDIGVWSMVVVLGIVGTALALSYLSPQRAVEWVRKAMEEQRSDPAALRETLGLEMQQKPEPPEAASRGSLPRQHLLGSSPDLSRQPVMQISVHDPLVDAYAVARGEQPMQRYYWRALTYDEYTGSGWSAGPTQAVLYPAGQPILEVQALPAYRTVLQTVSRSRRQDNTLYAASLLQRADQDVQVAWRSLEQSDIFGASLGEGIDPPFYQVESDLLTLGEVQLRAAGNQYPDWVTARYLQLPPDLPPEIGELARGLTGAAETPYDKALLLEGYLRSFPYTLDVPAPPAGRDVAAFFLFDLQEGYCDYAATSMAVMARTIGLPSRLVMGYASGLYDLELGQFQVTEADAHSWVEIYFPEIGWVEFEPTGGLPAIRRLADATTLEFAEPQPLSLPPLQKAPVNWLPWVGRAAALLAVLLAVIASGLLAEAWRLRRLSPQAMLLALYRRLYGHGRRLDLPHYPGDTPHDFAQVLGDEVTSLGRSSRWEQQLSPAGQQAQELVDEYARSIYSPHPPGAEGQLRTIRAWQRLRLRLWLAWWVQRLRRAGRRFRR